MPMYPPSSLYYTPLLRARSGTYGIFSQLVGVAYPPLPAGRPSSFPTLPLLSTARAVGLRCYRI